MARFNYRQLSKAERDSLTAELVEVMESVKKKQDLQAFFLQLVTQSEAVMLARRWQVAKRLAAGKSYRTIAEELSIGISTIESVDRWLSDTIGDYRAKLEEAQAKAARRRIRRERVAMPDSFTSVRYRYGLPFLLLNLLIEGIDVAAESAVRDKHRSKLKTAKKSQKFGG